MDNNNKRNGVLKKIGIVVGIACIVVTAVVAGIFAERYGLLDSIFTSEETVTSVTVSEILEPASEMITAKDYYTNYDVLDNSAKINDHVIPLTEEKIAFTYSGTVSAGFDIDRLCKNITVDDVSKTITIKLPKIKVMTVEIDDDSIDTLYEVDSVFRETTIEDLLKKEGELRKKMRKDASENEEFMSLAEEHGKTLIQNLLKSTAITEGYTVEFK